MLKNWQYLGDNAPAEAKAKGAKFSSRYIGQGGNFTTYYNDKGDKAEAKKYAQHLEDSYPSSPYYNDISKEIL